MPGKAVAGKGQGGLAFGRWLLGTTGGYMTLVAVIIVILYAFNLGAIANVADSVNCVTIMDGVPALFSLLIIAMVLETNLLF